ncbi:hypothetical protein TNCT_604561 [Trichonephila clavata]|uniref:Uncharacterized protein n=1 Tax=Trichonephila clavata TaxID=2740835 RepID=A0A8X6HJ20_TRICU|nr:hypothetical protein TNCT_604561 [Trichonephila clavata]
MPGTGETVAAYYCQELQGYSALGTPLSSYDDEVAAIHSAASQLENCNNSAKAVDSQAAVRNLSCNSQTDCKITIDLWKKLNYLLGLG